MKEYMLIVAGLITAALTGAGGAEMVKALLGRRPRRTVQAEAEASMVKTAQEYAQSMEADAREARTAAQEAWRGVHEAEHRTTALNRRLDEVTYNVSMLGHYVNWLVELILLPSTTIEEARQAVTIRRPPTMRNTDPH